MASRSAFTFFHSLRVRWSEVDLQGIVFNPRYFEYADVGFAEYMRAIGAGYPASLRRLGVDLVAVTATANFRASAKEPLPPHFVRSIRSFERTAPEGAGGDSPG